MAFYESILVKKDKVYFRKLELAVGSVVGKRVKENKSKRLLVVEEREEAKEVCRTNVQERRRGVTQL